MTHKCNFESNFVERSKRFGYFLDEMRFDVEREKTKTICNFTCAMFFESPAIKALKVSSTKVLFSNLNGICVRLNFLLPKKKVRKRVTKRMKKLLR